MEKVRKKSLQYPGEICRPTETIVEKIGIEPFRPAYVPQVELGAIEELSKLLKPMGVPKAPKAVAPKPELTPVLVQEIKNSQYKNFDLDTSVARTDEPLGLRDMGIVADSITILAVGGGFSYRLNSRTNDLTTAVLGLSETEFEIEEIYITNAAVAGTAIIRVNWNPFLIRLKP